MWFRLALRLFRRELGRGELTVIAAAIALAVLAVFSLSSISSRIQSAILQKGASFIAADRVLQSANPVSDAFFADAPLDGVRQARQILFTSMVFANDELTMASLKAVTESYPLRGKLVFAPMPDAAQQQIVGAPVPGEVWVAKRLLDRLHVAVGDTLEVGVAQFRISGVLIEEPDGGFNPFNSAPRVMMNYQDVAKTQVIQPGSRITYRYLFAAPENKLAALNDWLKPKLLDNQRWYDVKQRQSPIANALERSEQFLLLSGLLGVILAAVAIAVAAQRYCQRHYDPVAIFKTLGAGSAQVRKIYTAHLAMLTLLSIVQGLVLGYGVQYLVFDMIREFLPKPLPPVGARPFVMAVATGVCCALMFSLYPLLQLFDIPPLRVLRRSEGESKSNNWGFLLSAGLTVFLLMLAYSRSWKISLVLFGGGAVLILVLMLLSRVFINAGRAVGVSPSNPFKLAMASIKRRVRANSVQLITFTFAIHLLLALYVLKNDMVGEWRAQLPVGAPNHFLVNISGAELDDVKQMMTRLELTSQGLYPIVLGRLTAVDGEHLLQPVSKEKQDKSDRGGRQGIGRELNMTWTDKLPKGNEVVKGHWFEPGEQGKVSVEEKVAKRLDIKVGSKLTFLIGADEYTVEVSSLRKVDWNTLQPNFYMIFTADVLKDFPATYITAFNVPPQTKRSLDAFLQQYPTITAIEIDTIIKQIQSNIEQVAMGIGFVLVIVVLAGILVLIAQVQSSMEERRQEILILRTLGAKGSLIRYAVMLEFLLLGVIAGTMATIATEGLLAVLQSQVFKMHAGIHWHIWWMGPVIGGCFVAAVGLLSTARLLNRNTAQMLRTVIS